MAAGMKRTLLQAMAPAPVIQHRPMQHAGDSCTLFIGHLTEAVTQGELSEYAASQGGFVKVTMKGEGSPKAVAWAEFMSPEFAQVALMNLQAIPLASMGKAPNLEIARG